MQLWIATVAAQMSYTPTLYELYSWQKPNKGWEFCLLPSPSGANVSPKQVFGNINCQLHGINELNQRLDKLPEGSTVLWLNHFTGHGQDTMDDKKLVYPPLTLLEAAQHQAQGHKVKLEIPGKN